MTDEYNFKANWGQGFRISFNIRAKDINEAIEIVQERLPVTFDADEIEIKHVPDEPQ